MQAISRLALAYAVNSLWQLPLLFLAAEIVVRVLGRARGRVLCRVWWVVLAVALVSPALAFIAVPFRATSAARPTRGAANDRAVAVSGRGPLRFAFLNSLPDEPGQIDRAFSKLPGVVSSCILCLYLSSMIVAAGRFGRGLWKMFRLVRSAGPAEVDEESLTIWRRCQALMGVRNVKLLATSKLGGPATLYWPKPIILIPRSLESADSAEMSAVFCHELAHVLRKDFIWNVVMEALGVLLFYHPAFHWMRRRIQETRELACDDLAAEAVRGRRAYARNLLSLTQKLFSSAAVPQPGCALGIFEGEVLERRIMNLLAKRSKFPILRMATSAILGTCLIVVTAVISASFGLRLVNAQSALPANHAPTGWFLAGSKPANYQTGVDRTAANHGQPSAFLRSAVANPDGFGTLMQSISATDYAGKRVRLRAWVKSQDVADWAGVWMRVDKEQTMVAFDNMEDRPIKGTQPWKTYDVVLDVPQNSTGISFGILLSGSGEVWMNDVGFETVGNEVPVTATLPHDQERPKRPANLKFTE